VKWCVNGVTRSDPVVSPMAGLALAVVAVSTSAILVRWSQAPSVVAAFYRVLLTTLLVAPIAIVRYPGQFRRLSLRDGGVAIAAGLALAAHFATWFESLSWTSVAASVTLVQAQPLFVAVGAALLLEERITLRTVAGIAIAFAGVIGLSMTDFLAGATLSGAAPLYGDALALVGAVTAAAYVLAGRSLRQRLPLLPYVTIVYTACASALFAVVLAQGAPVLAYPPREWLLFLGMAVGPGIVGHTVINWALAHVESSVVSVSLLGEPVGSTLLAVVLLAEVPHPLTVASGGVVLAGIYVTAAARSAGA
jgi:drug/metabolite transporter (DMT)-like permease